MTAQRWLDLWEVTLRHGLEACSGVPTVLFDAQDMLPNATSAIQGLKRDLEGAGVRGLHMPSDEEIELQFLYVAVLLPVLFPLWHSKSKLVSSSGQPHTQYGIPGSSHAVRPAVLGSLQHQDGAKWRQSW